MSNNPLLNLKNRSSYLCCFHVIRSVFEDHFAPLARKNHASLRNAAPRRVRIPLALPAEVVAYIRGVDHIEPEEIIAIGPVSQASTVFAPVHLNVEDVLRHTMH